MIQRGYDGSDKEILDTYLKILEKKSILLTIYFYYLQAQRFIFNGHFNSLDSFSAINSKIENGIILSFKQREEFRKEVSSLMVTWSWNGVDLPLFLLVLISVFGVLENCLFPLTIFMTFQFIFTMIFHRAKI